jgi:hypothetical protein
MKAKKQRGILRVVHLVLSGMLGVYIYAPPEETGDLRLICQLVLFPALLVTGLWMWQQARVNRWLRRGKPAAVPAAATEAAE